MIEDFCLWMVDVRANTVGVVTGTVCPWSVLGRHLFNHCIGGEGMIRSVAAMMAVTAAVLLPGGRAKSARDGAR